MWARTVATKPGDWWDAGSVPMLSAYCRASAIAPLVAQQIKAVIPFISTDEGLLRFKELRKIQVALSGEISALATKMRLTQQARYNAKNSDTAARRGGGDTRKPWHHDVIEG